MTKVTKVRLQEELNFGVILTSSHFLHTPHDCAQLLLWFVCEYLSVSRRDGAVMLSKRRRKIPTQTPISSTGPSPLARWRIALCSGALWFCNSTSVPRLLLETDLDLEIGVACHGDEGRTYFAAMKARGDGWPTTRVSGDDAVAIRPAFAVEESEQRTRVLALFRGLCHAMRRSFSASQ
jgi:hypothetical protein